MHKNKHETNHLLIDSLQYNEELLNLLSNSIAFDTIPNFYNDFIRLLQLLNIQMKRRNRTDNAKNKHESRPSFLQKKNFSIENETQLIELLKKKIKIPKDKKKQPRVVIYASPVRSGSTAALLAAITSQNFREYYHQPFKYFLRDPEAPELIIEEKRVDKEAIIFIKTTIGPLFPEEYFDPVKILVMLGYDPEKIKLIELIRDPVETFYSISRIELDKNIGACQFNHMYTEIVALFTQHIIHSYFAIPKPVPLIFEQLSRLNDKNEIINLMELMFGTKFYPKFPDLETLLKMENIKWLEADPKKNPQYFEKVILPVLNKGQYIGGYSDTDREQVDKNHPDLLAAEAEIIEQSMPIYKLFVNNVEILQKLQQLNKS
jgi:hypothetical protein